MSAIFVASLFPSLSFAAEESKKVPIVDSLLARDIKVVDKDGKVMMSLSAQESGQPALSLYDKNQKQKISIGLFPGGQPGVALYSSDGNVTGIFRLTDDEKTPVLLLKEGGIKTLALDTDFPNRFEPAKVMSQEIAGEAQLIGQKELLIFTLGGFIGGVFGGVLSVMFLLRRQKSLEGELTPKTTTF